MSGIIEVAKRRSTWRGLFVDLLQLNDLAIRVDLIANALIA